MPPPKKKPASVSQAIDNEGTNSQVVKGGGDKESSGSNQSSQVVKEVRKSQPVRGTAVRVCGCYGTYHQPLTNCLHCGRISCSEEGYDFCPFCGFLVEAVDKGIE